MVTLTEKNYQTFSLLYQIKISITSQFCKSSGYSIRVIENTVIMDFTKMYVRINLVQCCVDWSSHTVVCCVAKENWTQTNGVSILTGATKSRFSHICSSMIPYPNDTKFTVELASTQGRPHFIKIPQAIFEIWVSKFS